MRFGNFHYRARRNRQQGYVLLYIVLLVTLVLIALSAEAPRVATQLRRDREEELIHRGAQYARAIKRYYKKVGAYPVRLEQLEDTNHIRFLRKRYKDPMTGEDFRLLHFGEVNLAPKTPGMGTGPGIAAGSGLAGPGGPASTGAVGPDGQRIPQGQAASPFVSFTQMGGKGPTLGGGPIIGVASTSKKQSLHVFNEKDHYKDWEFIYDPTMERCVSTTGCLINGPYNGPPKFGGGTIPGALNPSQMQPGQGQPGASPFGQPTSPFGTPQR